MSTQRWIVCVLMRQRRGNNGFKSETLNQQPAAVQDLCQRVDLYLNFENHTESNARASVRIMHPTGTVLKQLSLDAIPGKNAASLNVQNMPIGWYLLEVQLNGERQVVKWMKQD